MTSTIHLAFFWHMHQPCYVEPMGGKALLPWVRLHAISAYTDMAALLAAHPHIRATVSFSPSLLDQLANYEKGAEDTYEQITLRPAADLTIDEREFLIRHFFSVNWARIMPSLPTYQALLEKRGRELAEEAWLDAAQRFSIDELRDLQVLFNLAWFGSSAIDAEISDLLKRGQGYSEADKQLVLSKQRKLIQQLLPAWRQLVQQGTVEPSCCPYYHPIIPLIIDSNTAKRANPEVELPERFSFPEDAEAHVRRGVARVEKEFGTPLRGLWLSEAALSPEAVQMAQKCGLSYVVGDAEILFHSLDDRGGTPGRGRMFQPFTTGACTIFFRDDQLSVRVGREYAAWEDSRAAASDLIQRVLEAGRRARVDGNRPPLVTIALDGENPWESYPARGQVFLTELYRQLAETDAIRVVTLGEHLDAHPASVGLDYLHSGSWIEANFDVWIGDPEKNRAWNLLGRARQKLAREQMSGELAPEQLAAATEHVYRAECSDWFWWIGEPFFSAEDSIYEFLFRGHLQAMYDALGESPPADLLRPLGQGGVVEPLRQPTTFITPRIDGTRTSFFEWRGAGFYRVPGGGSSGAADAAESGPFIAGLYWGFDAGRLFLRLDPVESHIDAARQLGELEIWFEIAAPDRSYAARLHLDETPHLSVSVRHNGKHEDLGTINEVAFLQVLELAIPFGRLGVRHGTRLGLTIHFGKRGQRLATVPRQGCIEIEVPSDDFGT